MARNVNRRRAKRLLEEAAPHIGRDVVVIGPGTNGEGYLATSMPTKSAEDIAAILTMVEEARRKLLAWQRRRKREERTLTRVAVELEA